MKYFDYYVSIAEHCFCCVWKMFMRKINIFLFRIFYFFHFSLSLFVIHNKKKVIKRLAKHKTALKMYVCSMFKSFFILFFLSFVHFSSFRLLFLLLLRLTVTIKWKDITKKSWAVGVRNSIWNETQYNKLTERKKKF